MTATKDRTGLTYGRLTVTGRAPDGRWTAICECGTVKTYTGSNLTNGHTRSCGCVKRELAAVNARKLSEPKPKWDCAALAEALGY